MARVIKAVAFDLDGTICLGSRLMDGAGELVRFVRDEGLRLFFLTNASTQTRRQL